MGFQLIFIIKNPAFNRAEDIMLFSNNNWPFRQNNFGILGQNYET